MALSKKSLFIIVFSFLALHLGFSLAYGEDREKSPAFGPQRPLSEILNPDGTLKLGTSIQGSFDPRGFQMVSGPGEQPRFVPAGSGLQSEGSGLPPIAAVPGDENWDSQFNNFYTDLSVYAIAVSGTDVYVGGAFTDAGGVAAADYIAKWDGLSWSALGSGLNSWVFAIAVSGTDVYVGGQFTDAGGIAPADYVAKWNGSSWSALGSGLNYFVRAIAVSGTDIYVGGAFTDAGGVAEADRIAKWNGSSWSALGSGLNSSVYAIAVSGADVYAGGQFTDAGGVTEADYIAKWNGSSWSALGSGLKYDVYAIAVSGTDVYVGGNFPAAGGIAGADRIAKWNGSIWSALGSGLNSSVFAIAVSGTDVYVGGNFTDAGEVTEADYIAKWNGSSWSALGSGLNNSVDAIAVSGTDLYVGGEFTQAGGHTAGHIAKWDIATSIWPALGSGLNGPVWAIAVSGADVYVGGEFRDAGGVAEADLIAKWNGTNWSALGSGVGGVKNPYVYVIAVSGSDIYVGGIFTQAGGAPANNIAKWNGTNWSALGSGLNYVVDAIAVSGTDVYVGGYFTQAGGAPANYIAKWNGTNWSVLGSGVGRVTNPYVYAIEVSGSDIYVGGYFTQAGGKPSYCFGRWMTSLGVTSPNGGEVWEVGSAHNITWMSQGIVGNVKIEYSTNNGSTWTTVVASTDNDGTYTWTVPNTPSSQCRVRISEAADGNPVDTSDGTFTIAGFKLTVPNGGEQWLVGSPQTITWDTAGSFSAVKIELSTNNGSTYQSIISGTANTGSFPWTVPDMISSQCLIKVSDATDGIPSDASDAVFSIVPVPAITVTSPNGGESWEVGSSQNITWTSQGTVGDVKIEYSTNSGSTYTVVVASTGNDGIHPWTVPNAVSSTCLVRVSEIDGSPSDASDAVFSIVLAPAITVTSPNGEENWEVGSSQNITWTSQGTVGDVKIEYSTNSGSSYTVVVASTGNDGTYPWIVPDTVSTTCLVRVSETDGSPSDVSDAVFSIVPVPAITVTSPNGGEKWLLGSTHDITWTSAGLSGDVTIELLKGLLGTTLGTTSASSGSFSWKIASGLPVGNDYRIHIYQGGVEDYSDDYFSLEAGKDDLVGTWDGKGVYYRNSDTKAWVKLATPANLVAVGDLDGDGIDDLIGIWPSQSGVWVKYSKTATWAKLGSTAKHIASGDMNGDGRVDLVGTWDGMGVYYRNSVSGSWVKLASPASLITAGDLDGDNTDDLIGIWPSQGGVWVKYSQSGAWAKLGSSAVDIAAGDMNGDGRDDLLGTWDGQGVYYRNSKSGAWVKMSAPASQVAAGDLDGDGTDDLIGIWPSQGGVWVKYSKAGNWSYVSSAARDIAAGKMRSGGGGGSAGTSGKTIALRGPFGGLAEGPETIVMFSDRSDEGPGGWRFVFLEDINLVPGEGGIAVEMPGPGDPWFTCTEQRSLMPRADIPIPGNEPKRRNSTQKEKRY